MKSRHPRSVPVQHGLKTITVRNTGVPMHPVLLIAWVPLSDWLNDPQEVIRRAKVACAVIHGGLSEGLMEIEVGP